MLNELNPASTAATNKLKLSALLQIALGILLLIGSIVFFMSASSDGKADASKEKAKTELTKDLEKDKDPEKKKLDEGFFSVKLGDRFFAGAWALAMGLGFVCLGSWTYTRTPKTEDEANSAFKSTLILAGSLIGFLTFCLGIILGYWWSGSLTDWLEQGKVKEARWPFFALLAVFGGLVIMFLGLQIARSDLRKSAGLRRLYYGFSAVMTGLFLLSLLLSLNIYSSMKWTSVLDTTEKGYYTLDPKSKEVLSTLSTPVKAYLIWPPGNSLFGEVSNMLTNCEKENPNFQVVPLDPSFDAKEIFRLNQQYKLGEDLRDQLGILLVVGEKENQTVFLKIRDLVEQKFGNAPGEESLNFIGEGRVMAELAFLGEGKVKPIIYFLQGNGELDISIKEPQPRKGPRDVSAERSASMLVQYLQDRKYDVRPLKLELNGTTDFDTNATAVVLLAPSGPYSEGVVKFLTEYMEPTDPKRKPGKLVAILPPTVSPINRKIAPTGLEKLISDFGMDILPAKIVQYSQNGALETPIVEPSDDLQGSILARAFPRMEIIPNLSRPIRAQQGLRPELKVQRVLATTPNVVTWLETDGVSNNEAVFRQLRQDKNLQKEKMAGQQELGVIAVSSMAPLKPQDPQAPPTPPAEHTPRMVVLGWEAFNNRLIQMAGNSTFSFDMLGDLIDWLRERPTNIGIKPQERKYLKIPADVTLWKVLVQPFLLFLCIVTGFGVSIWIVRRK
ncbi:Gldg family protein [Telmatocola sphagniphila]|uniref:Gldg family protein n=1 Tax=Telmatocola sphagniphila TaxID=1123043 RepID=A0A8E6B276_9BACT|nr:Gldg family protein [Telmatocola sphagniphila]QVL29904.1 Gldg family protein [Telmatocola sphagniphila]